MEVPAQYVLSAWLGAARICKLTLQYVAALLPRRRTLRSLAMANWRLFLPNQARQVASVGSDGLHFGITQVSPYGC